MPVRTKRVYDKALPEDGRRLLVMRLWPRGVAKDRVDGWEKDLGAPPELIREWKGGSIAWEEFARRYRKAMEGQRPKIAALAERAERETITLLCGCADETRCHRTLLKDMIEGARRRPGRAGLPAPLGR